MDDFQSFTKLSYGFSTPLNDSLHPLLFPMALVEFSRKLQ